MNLLAKLELWLYRALATRHERRIRAAAPSSYLSINAINRFIEERCVVKAGAFIATKDLYEAYAAWCVSRESEPVTELQFVFALARRNFDDLRHRLPGSAQPVRCWRDLDLKKGLEVSQ